jgi:hypothetical protein
MLRNTVNGLAPSPLPTLANVRQRAVELLDLQSQLQAQPRTPTLDPPSRSDQAPQSSLAPPQRSTNPACPACPGTPRSEPWVLGEAALYGLAGLAVRTIAPHTEAHPAAILLQLLAAFGNLVGPGPHCMVDATRHGLNLFVVLVGDSSKARKGTSWGQVARLFAEVDRPWLSTRVTSGCLTAGGLVYALRDQQPPTDRRLLALSEEFASILYALKRGKAQLSPLLRSAWDSGNLPTLNMRLDLQATGTHISLIAHITQRELAQSLQHTETHNGFANRCLWTWVQRNSCLPEGGDLSDSALSAVARELRRALDWAAATPEILFRRDDAARKLWQDCYPTLSQLRPGLRGAATSRAEAQVLRLSAIYAALDTSSVVGLPHLQAALAVWDYCSTSAIHLFGDSTGDAIADRILEALVASPHGLSKHQIRRLFHGHVSCDRIDAALEQLTMLEAANCHSEPTRGRSASLWSANAVREPDEHQGFLNDLEEFVAKGGGL